MKNINSQAKKRWSKLAKRVKILIVLIVLGVIGFILYNIFFNSSPKISYQTSQVEKGTLVTIISGSGSISQAASGSITSNTSGIVSAVYVKNGDTVSQGDKIAEINPDITSQQKQAAAWASYLQAKTSLDATQSKMNSLQAAEFKANQTFINDAVNRNLPTNDPTYIQENALWLQAEADYKNQAAVIQQSQAVVSSAWLSYTAVSSTITAPMSGTISGLTLTEGTTVGNSSGNSGSSSTSTSTTTSSNSNTSTSIGLINSNQGMVQAIVNLTEVDVTKVQTGQKVTLTLDAFPDKTFTGKVSAINTNGTVSSGVTTYPTTITFDTADNKMYPNMAVNAKIITSIKNNVLLVPSAAVQTSNGTSTVRVMNNGSVSTQTVEIGDANDTQIEIVSGLKEGDTIVTNSTSSSSQRTSTGNSTSPFSGVGSNRGFGGGGIGR